MPADASGVTTDDHGPHPRGTADQSSGQGDSHRSEASTPRGAGDAEHAVTGPDEGTDQPASTPVGGGAADAVPPGDDAATASTTPVSGDDPASTSTWSDPAGDVTEPGEPGQAVDAGPPNGATAELTTDPRPELAPGALAGGEPPPAPVLAPSTAPGRGGRGRHASPRRDRASRRGLRVDQRLWAISPWSVFKISALFYLCLGLILLVAGTLLYNAGRSIGTIDQFESFVTRMGAYGECVAKADVEAGAEFEEDEDKCGEGEVLVGGFALDDGTLFRAAAIGGAILVVGGAITSVLMTVLLNLLNEVTGGIRHTVIKEPVARPPGAGPGRPRSPAGGGPPGGSPRHQPQR